MKDLELLAAKFLTSELPKHKEYLHKYFKGDLQERMVVYYLLLPYEDNKLEQYYHNFCDHTGIWCHKGYIVKLIEKLHIIEERLNQAITEKDHETVALIKSGKWKWRKKTITPSE